jgi:hypothetical protein
MKQFSGRALQLTDYDGQHIRQIFCNQTGTKQTGCFAMYPNGSAGRRKGLHTLREQAQYNAAQDVT